MGLIDASCKAANVPTYSTMTNYIHAQQRTITQSKSQITVLQSQLNNYNSQMHEMEQKQANTVKNLRLKYNKILNKKYQLMEDAIQEKEEQYDKMLNDKYQEFNNYLQKYQNHHLNIENNLITALQTEKNVSNEYKEKYEKLFNHGSAHQIKTHEKTIKQLQNQIDKDKKYFITPPIYT